MEKSKIVSKSSSRGRGAVSAKSGRLAQGDKLGGGGQEGAWHLSGKSGVAVWMAWMI